jgi:hypothetical protein
MADFRFWHFADLAATASDIRSWHETDMVVVSVNVRFRG